MPRRAGPGGAPGGVACGARPAHHPRAHDQPPDMLADQDKTAFVLARKLRVVGQFGCPLPTEGGRCRGFATPCKRT